MAGPMSSFFVRTRFIAKRLHHHCQRSYSQTQNSSYKKLNKGRSLLLVSAGSVLAYVGGSLVFGDERFYRDYAMPAVHYLLDGEDAHRLAVAMAKWNLVPLEWRVSHPATQKDRIEENRLIRVGLRPTMESALGRLIVGPQPTIVSADYSFGFRSTIESASGRL